MPFTLAHPAAVLPLKRFCPRYLSFPALIAELGTLRFVEDATNVLFIGPPGVGKTMLAVGLGHAAVAAGMRAYYTTASELAAAQKDADSVCAPLAAFGTVVDEPAVHVTDEATKVFGYAVARARLRRRLRRFWRRPNWLCRRLVDRLPELFRGG